MQRNPPDLGEALEKDSAHTLANDKLNSIIDKIENGYITKETNIDLLEGHHSPSMINALNIANDLNKNLINPKDWLILISAFSKGRSPDQEALGSVRAILGKNPKR